MNKEKYTQNFKTTIQNKLSEIAEVNPEFAVSLAKENKNIDECINYILSTVQKSGVQGYTDDEVFGMAMHYYDQDDVSSPKAIDCHVVINHHVELSEEERKQQKEKALHDLYLEEKARMRRKPTPAKTTENTNPQISLFQ